MKKRDGVLYSLSLMFVVLIIILSSNFAIAANQTTVNMTGFDKSDACLKQLIDNTGYSSMTPEQLAFSLLALGYDSAR